MAPTLLWFGVFAIGALVAKGDVVKLADRIARRADQPAAPPGMFGAGGAIADEDTGDDGEDEAAAEPDDPAAPAGREAARVAHLEDVCIEGTAEHCQRWAMDGAYEAIADGLAGRAWRPIRISYYGDSVTSTDVIPSRVRTRLQKRLGDGGPGFVFAARPHRFVRHEVVGVTNSGRWTTWGVSTAPAPDGLHGVGGSSTETIDGVGRYTTTSPVREAEVYFLRQPGGGTADVVMDGRVMQTIDTAGAAKQAEFARVTAAAPARTIEVRARGRVRLFGVVLENPAGAVVDNMGLVSATVKNVAHNRADHWKNQIAHRGADLVIVMLGANEAEWLPPSRAAMAEYRDRYEAILAPVRAALPRASCLVISPLDQAQDNGGQLASRPVMPMMVAAQRAAAGASGCAFFSAYDWAGGKGSSLVWHRRKWVNDDFQHLAHPGANRLGDAIVNALLVGARGRAAR